MSGLDERKHAHEVPQSPPGEEAGMQPAPLVIRADYRGAGKLAGKVALISGGDSGIGRAVAVHFAREGCDIAFLYLNEHEDAAETQRLIEAEGRNCLARALDARSESACREAIDTVIERFQRLDILVNNIARQVVREEPEEITPQQLAKTFETNVYPAFMLTRHALEHMGRGSSIINTGSVVSFRGHAVLMDYAASKGAIEAFTYSLAQKLAGRGIRVNGVAPGPIWTPLIVSSFSREHIDEFGKNTLLKRPGQPAEVAPAYVYLASADASYVTGQFIHINGGGFIG